MPPLVTTTVSETRGALHDFRAQGRSIGLVPTMGALHAGHGKLLERAKAENDIAVASVFVNPTQFAPGEDFHRYPRPFDADVALCSEAGVDVIFHPDPIEMYPTGFQTHVEVERLQKSLCGLSRPTHFRGVATVVLKLLQIVQPDRAYFGQKDAQQARLMEQMVLDLNVPSTIVICPIIREPDGLAMSSRNRYLSPEDRRNATVLFRCLERIRTHIEAGARQAEPLLAEARSMIAATPGAKIDYIEIVNWDSLQPIEVLKGRVLIAIAVKFGTTRLIDNWRADLPD